jgi:hypothetical protein
VKITAETITDEQIRELLADTSPPTSLAPITDEREPWWPLAALGDKTAMWALNTTQAEARARCAEILNARRSK